MKIKDMNKDYIQDLYEFDHRMFPQRKNYKEVLDFYFAKEEHGEKYSNIIVDDDNKIVGQHLFFPVQLYYKDETINSYWSFDWIVDEKIRNAPWGISLLIYSNKKALSCGVGSNDTSMKISTRLGFRQIGSVKKYIKIANLLYVFTAFMRGNIKCGRFPKEVKVKNKCYRITDSNNLPDLTKPYNDDLIEYGRNSNFLKWRFFSGLHDYAFYKETETDDFFVVRSFVRCHITGLELADYRCKKNDGSDFDSIYKAVVEIAKNLCVPLIYTASSLKVFDDVLENNGAKRNGRDRPITTSLKIFDERKDKFEDRDFIFVTLADSDGETTL